jgi:hypothetical protein
MCGEGGYNARGGGDRGMREWRGGPEVICHSPPSFASPRPRSHLPALVRISRPSFVCRLPSRLCVVCPLVRVSFVPPFAAVVSATPAATADVDVAVAVAAAVRMPTLALSCRWRWRCCRSPFIRSSFGCSPFPWFVPRSFVHCSLTRRSLTHRSFARRRVGFAGNRGAS